MINNISVIKLTLTVLFFVFSLINQPIIFAHELSGYAAVEGRGFFNDALFSDQERDNASFAFQPEYYHEWESGSSFTFVPFARIDSADSERTHFDVRELNFLWLGNNWELRVGIGKVFWGTTEFVHLVDIINQTDLVENIDGEDKLGQPMIHLSIPRDWGVVDLFVLPYFRERTFQGKKGRLRSAVLVDTERVKYENADEEHHVDFAVRYSHTIGDWDVGIYHFNGTGREPTLLSDEDSDGNPVFIPYYEQINQTGLDLQLVAGEWLWKLEALYRNGQGDNFFASVGGFEYTFVGIAETRMDLGIIGEWAYDDRGDAATTASDNDAMFGLRLALNDASSTELLAGFLQDINSSSRALSLEASRRIGDNWKATFEARGFFNLPESDPFYSLRDDDFLQIELAYYY
ncbi:MAG TPA: hypothetical protein DCM60_05765 [Nitrospina sp.]|nr:hypothetical protein [Nitrospina sp.]|tara:strand:+ start:4684 stop:5895 length:1212 start_codon:yes stop_codon:yes gene_type:complete